MLQLLVAAVLIVCNGLFALSELAIVSSRKARLQARADAGSRGAREALALLEQPGRFLSTVQIGITLVGILAGAFSGAALGADVAGWLRATGLKPWLAEAAGYALVLGLITYLSVVIGELVPKHLALRNPESIACVMAMPMALLSKLAAPLVWLLDGSAKLVLRLLGQAPGPGEAVSDDEIRALIAEAARTGVIEHDEREMMAAVMRFGDRSARSLMTPRTQVEVIDIAASASEMQRLLGAIRHQTVPVVDGAADRVIGILRLRDLLPGLLKNHVDDGLDLRPHVRQAPVVPDSVSALKALTVLREATVPLAIVRDEYGNFEGILTPADVLDAIAGAFRSDTLPREAAARQVGEDVWEIAGSMPADEMADLLALDLPRKRRFQTVGGFLVAMFGDIPQAGASIETGGWKFTIVSMNARRVGTVRAERS
ncbi:MAG: hemolysin family protein [Beijerinckiaceae bacterium]